MIEYDCLVASLESLFLADRQVALSTDTLLGHGNLLRDKVTG
jgi:hypothetical protein